MVHRSRDVGAGQNHRQQVLADERFTRETTEWRDLYAKTDVASIVLQERLRRAEGFVERLELTPRTVVADVGCGAGLMSVAAAKRGAWVHAIDTVASMLDLTREQAETDGVGDRVALTEASVESLPLRGESVDVLIALGLLAWVPSPSAAVKEIARVVRPGAYVIVTSGNPVRLQSLIDPLQNPFLRPIKHTVKHLAGRAQVPLPVSKAVPRHWHSPKQLERLLSSAGLAKVDSTTFGFGPFTFFRKKLPERLGMFLHKRLQVAADSGVPGLSSCGAIHMVLARRGSATPEETDHLSAPGKELSR